MTIQEYKNFLFEKRLTIPELNKENDRWMTFLAKLKTGSPFESYVHGEVNITNAEEIIHNITNDNGTINMFKVVQYLKPKNRYAKVIQTDHGRHKLNEFRKTIDFGGGTGISLGSINARTYETIQAYFFSLRQYLGRDVVPSDIHYLYHDTNQEDVDINEDTDRAEIFNYVNSVKKITLEDIVYFEERGWIYTYIKTANEFSKILNENRQYSFYHSYAGIGVADEIYQAFNRSIKDINKENNLIISMSRWNPSDIWSVETERIPEILTKLRSINNLTSLNLLMDTLFDNKHFIGVSLKKIPESKDIELIVNKNLNTHFLYENTTTSVGPFDTLTVHINSKSYSWLGQRREEVLDARIYSGNKSTNIFLEIRGSRSKYGKSSLTYVNSILNRVGITPIPDYKDITLTDLELRNKIVEYYNTIPNLDKSYSTSIKNNIEGIRSKLISKYQSLMLADILEKNRNKRYKSGVFSMVKFLFNRKLTITNYIVKEIFYYAYSMGGELFDNTKFYRIKTNY